MTITRSQKQSPARVPIQVNVMRELDRQLRAWAWHNKVSMASIVESALTRHFRQMYLDADEQTTASIERVIRTQRRAR